MRVNCETFLQICRDNGLPAKVTDTVSDDEYQRQLVSKGYASKKAMLPTFHSVKAGLAFDICKDVADHGYDDPKFFKRCSEIEKKMGFSRGGAWKSFPDRLHFQWDANGRYSSMILAGKYPPQMEEYDYMNQDKFDAMMDTYLAKHVQLPVDEWAAEVWAASS